jgi:hypothetical protein
MPTNPVFTPVDGSGNVMGQVASGDSITPGSVPGSGVLVFNGTTFDRLRGSNGAINVLTQAAFNVYTESAVVSGARLTNGNTNAGSFPNNASAFFVSVVVSVFTGGTNVTYSLQQQDANGNWVTVGSTAAITATGTYGFSVGPGMTNGNLLVSGAGQYRVAWTVTGTFSALTSQVGITGR